jgi:L-ornithine N5-oxygenase
MLRNLHGGGARELCVDAVVLATGFKNFGGGENEEPYHPLLKHIAQLAGRRPDGDISVSRDYRVRALDGDRLLPIFLNGLCESSHGFGDAGSFSLLSLRAQMIADSLMEILGMQGRNTQPRFVDFTHSVAAVKEEPADA